MQIKGPKYAILGTQHPQSNVAQKYYMKIILLVSLKSEEDILKVIASNTFHRSSFIQISF
jgi:tryptophan synthase alpha subunit